MVQNELAQLEECEEKMGLNLKQTRRKVELITKNLNSLSQEETYWYNRSHETWLHKGDNNTSFFHKCANGSRRKTTILSLEKDGELIERNENLLDHATEYYKGLFGPEPRYDFRIDPTIWDDCENLEDTYNLILC